MSPKDLLRGRLHKTTGWKLALGDYLGPAPKHSDTFKCLTSYAVNVGSLSRSAAILSLIRSLEEKGNMPRILEIMTANPVVLTADTTVREAAQAMRDKAIGDVVVQKNGKLWGMVTDRDIVVRAVAEGKDPATTKLESICSNDITSLSAVDSDEDAVRLMRKKAIRRLPVMAGEKVIGIVSLGDLAVEKDPQSALGRISSAQPNI